MTVSKRRQVIATKRTTLPGQSHVVPVANAPTRPRGGMGGVESVATTIVVASRARQPR